MKADEVTDYDFVNIAATKDDDTQESSNTTTEGDDVSENQTPQLQSIDASTSTNERGGGRNEEKTETRFDENLSFLMPSK